MKAERKAVKEWLRTMDRSEYDQMLRDALFTEAELRYIHMRCIEGKSFKEIAIECGLSRRTMCNIAKRIAEKMHKSFAKHEHYFH